MVEKSTSDVVSVFEVERTQSVWQVERYDPKLKEWNPVGLRYRSLKSAERTRNQIPSRKARRWYPKLELYRIVEIRMQRIVVQVDEGAP